MARTKQKAVVSAGKEQLAEVRGLIRAKRFRTVSEFVRVAIDEKLQRLRREDLEAQLERYIDAGYADEDDDLIAWQAWPGTRRAKR